jgi:Tol biopolymer transport system component
MPVGGTAVQLTFDPAPDWSPGWSPDGRQLAFYSDRTGDREIWTMAATGGAATRVTNSKGLDAGSDWSPDGREIAFRSERTGRSRIAANERSRTSWERGEPLDACRRTRPANSFTSRGAMIRVISGSWT